jgi:hypothetical protein
MANAVHAHRLVFRLVCLATQSSQESQLPQLQDICGVIHYDDSKAKQRLFCNFKEFESAKSLQLFFLGKVTASVLDQFAIYAYTVPESLLLLVRCQQHHLHTRQGFQFFVGTVQGIRIVFLSRFYL